jgi:ABC-type multidrug transport system ATPase subunit
MVEIKVDDVYKDYGTIQALQGVSFTSGRGITGLLGPNGAGKTTLLNIMATLIEPTSGQVSIGGFDVGCQRRQVRQIMGFLPQEFGLYDGLTAYEFLDYLAVLKGIRDRRRCVQQSLEQVGLAEFSKRRVGTFSSGMKQRLGIAQALLDFPPVLIVDEPTVGLDPAERNRFRQLLTQLATTHTIVLSTHLVEDILLAAWRVIVLHMGKVQFNGTVSEMVKQVHGKVWKVQLAQQELEIIRRDHLITHLEHNGNAFAVRIVSDSSPDSNARQASPTLEDAYLYLSEKLDGQRP